MTKTLLALGGASAIALVASAALAQAKPPVAARPGGATIAAGPPIPGMCVLAQRQVIATSKVGQYVSGRMGQIAAQWKAELTPEQSAIEAEAKSLEAARTTLAPAAYQTRVAALQARASSWQQKLDLRQRETQATDRKAVNRIAQELAPIVQQLYQQRRCSILIDEDVVMGANPEMDLSSQAITALNAKIQQFAFDREHLDTAGAAPAR